MLVFLIRSCAILVGVLGFSFMQTGGTLSQELGKGNVVDIQQSDKAHSWTMEDSELKSIRELDLDTSGKLPTEFVGGVLQQEPICPNPPCTKDPKQ